jgi:hypothetical protein
MIRCLNCGKDVQDTAKFCPACGAQVQPARSSKDVVGAFLFMGPVLRLISQGQFFRRVFSIALRVLAVVIALGGLVGWLVAWRLVFELPPAGILGGIIFQLLFVVAIYMVAHTLLIRATNIAELPDAEFTVIPIASIFLKLIGEVYACFVVVIAVGGGILTWFAGGYAQLLLQGVMPFVPSFGGETFVGGLLFMVGGALTAFFVLVSFYLLSELVVVMVDIASNTSVTRRIAEQYDKTKEPTT